MISVILRTQNRDIFLSRALKDISEQTYKNVEVIIVNDAGDKQVVERTVDNFPQLNIRIIHTLHSKGMESASNNGLKSSNGEFIVIHDDDDTWNKEFLTKTITFLEKNAKYIGVVVRSMEIFEKVDINTNKNPIIQLHKKPFNLWLKNITLKLIAQQNMFPPISFVYRRKLLENAGFYDEDLKVLGDWEFNLRALAIGEIAVIPEILANYHKRVKEKNPFFLNSDLKEHRMTEKKIRQRIQTCSKPIYCKIKPFIKTSYRFKLYHKIVRIIYSFL